jgi:hypothetical protein
MRTNPERVRPGSSTPLSSGATDRVESARALEIWRPPRRYSLANSSADPSILPDLPLSRLSPPSPIDPTQRKMNLHAASSLSPALCTLGEFLSRAPFGLFGPPPAAPVGM